MSNTKDGIKISGIVIGGIVAVATLGVILTFVFGGANWLTAPFRGEVDKREQTTGSGSFRIATYQDYFNICTAVQNTEASIQALEEERDGGVSDTRKAQIATSITALKSTRAASVNDYNAKSAQEHRAPFKDKGLPYRLDLADFNTTCA